MNAIIERARLSRKAAFQTKISVANVLADPPVAATFPGQDITGDLRIHTRYLSEDLDYLVGKPALEEDGDYLQPQIRKKGDTAWINIFPHPDFPHPDEYIELGPVADRDWTVPFKIPQSFLKEELTPETPTEWEFQYIYWADGTNDVASAMATFAIDRTYPYKVKNPASDRTPGAPTWPADLPPGALIDEAYLDGKTGIIVKPAIPSTNYLPSDIYKFYFGPTPDPARDTPVYIGVLSASQDAEIPVAVFTNATDGVNLLMYVAEDAAGNVARRSGTSQRTVAHTPNPDPGTVFPPIVTLANGDDGDDLIDYKDIHVLPQGVEFKVKVPTPNAPNDTIVGYWGGQPVGAEQRVGTNTELTFHAAADLVKQVYGDTDGIVPTTVSFKMFRGVNTLAQDEVDIDVDISRIGPDVMDPPRLTTTKGSINEILEADFGDTGIQAHIDVFATPPTEEGWFIDLFYDNVKFASPIALTTGQEGTTISRNLPWNIVETQEPGTKKLHYELYTPSGTNRNESDPRDILVEPFPIQMVAPEILGLAGPARRIGCATLNFPTATNPGDGTERRNLLVRVLPNTYTVDGETITVKYVAYPKDDPTTPIPDTDAVATYLISGVFPPDGAVIGIGDYEEDFKPAHQALGHVTYSISRGGAGNNPTPDSAAAIRELDLDDSEGRFCEEFVIPTP
jgi:hypothetical protein